MSADLAELRRSLPLVTGSHGEKVAIRLGDAITGVAGPVIVAGPCAVENLDQILTTARRVKAAGAHGLRGGAFKPRSSPYSFQGLGLPALEMLSAAKIETGLFLAIEVVGLAEVELVAGYADLLQIGARNMQNFSLLRAVGRSGRPVLLKRGLSATIQEWLQAAEYILAEGNPQVILCERGIRTFETLTRNTFDLAAIPLVQTITGLPVFADPSHATGRRELVAPMARAALAAGADGLMIEVHPEPNRALSDGDQSLSLEDFDALMAELRSTRAIPASAATLSSRFTVKPPLAAVRDLSAGGYRFLPYHCCIPGDELTPVGVYRRLAGDGPAFLLETVTSGCNSVGRYSFYGDRPLITLRARGEEVSIEDNEGRRETRHGDVLAILAAIMAELKTPPAEGPPARFHGGAVGYLGYDYVHQLEPVPLPAPDPLDLPTSLWLIPARLVILDHVTQIVTVMILDAASREGHARASALLERTAISLDGPPPADAAEPRSFSAKIACAMTEADYGRAVAEAKRRIADGEIFQLVLSHRLSLPYRGSALSLYRALRTENPSPYLFLLDCGRFQLVGSSPETMVRLEDGIAEIKPIAGTRPRGEEAGADLMLESELRADGKEAAEHVMLVDLGRNDLGRVCRPGTIRVHEFMTVERFSHVMHLVSRITGELAQGEDGISLLRASFPAGTLTGAPKVRAMQLISALEPHGRGVYGGAVGYLGFNGNLDTCIAIRMAVVKDGQATIQAGAGIVADSEPAREYAETKHKAAALVRALRKVEEVR